MVPIKLLFEILVINIRDTLAAQRLRTYKPGRKISWLLRALAIQAFCKEGPLPYSRLER